MGIKSRIARLENKAKARNNEGMKFVYSKDTVRPLYESIKGVSGPLVNDPDRHVSKDKGVEAGQSTNDVPNEER